MIRRTLITFAALVVFYVLFVQIQVVITRQSRAKRVADKTEVKPAHKVYAFSFTKYTPEGQKEIEIEGDSADILTNTVQLMNVMAKAYAEEVPVTVTADKGEYDKKQNKIHIEQNVVATTEDGTRLVTEQMDMRPTEHIIENDVQTQVKKDNINVEGMGARADTQLKKVKFKKNVTVIVQNPEDQKTGPTTITCDGPLVIDYDKNIAHFKDNVVAQDSRGKLMADTMDVYYNRVSRKVSKIVAAGNVVIENPDGNKTYSDSVIYLADEGRIILGGDTEALYFGGEGSKDLGKGVL
ncbi:MAG TPA: LPS export ABC transporter periplasmic protein LptC [Candidatus Omnitrophota bacterium]|nr:LPS export ABC transporter periplasmic protein LptC [Candidatus Omnitrophota bacterium]HPS36115.1 LPS export ABC transporter periplasmic protein LptC [Candidatus Omnitrophota bacterium]